MQQCLHCGQYNDDFEDHCIYCGEALYIQVDQDNIKMDHLYADSIAQELINDNTSFNDDIDEITKELLGETEKEDSFTIDNQEYYFDPSEEEYEKRDNQLVELEKELKNKLRRNKKLEIELGLIIRNIDVILDDITGPLLIMGELSSNDKLGSKKVKLSAITYNENKKVINNNHTIISIDHGNFKNFIINSEINIKQTSLIILLPEILENKEIQQKSEKETIKNEQVSDTNSIFIEQLTDIERKIGMTISNTSIIQKSDENIEIVGEIRIENPDEYHNIKIAATCYDKNNTIIATESTQINTKLFLGFDTLSIKINDITVNQIQRIRLYPTLQ